MAKSDQRIEVTPPTSPIKESNVILVHRTRFYFLAYRKAASNTVASSGHVSIYELEESTL